MSWRTWAWSILICPMAWAGSVDLRNAVVVVRNGAAIPERTAATVFVEEVDRRSGIRLPVVAEPPAGKTVVAIGTGGGRPEGYRISLERRAGSPATVRITGADARGTLFGVGDLLRKMEWGAGKALLPDSLDITTAPRYGIRGHQLGYRAHANSYDAWTAAQYEQYIRELAIFGTNTIEGIPFQDARLSPVMKSTRREMNRAISEICFRYGLDYWIWMPVDFDLRDGGGKRKTELLGKFEEFLKDAKELTGIFVPGGDPGNNPPELVLPFLAELAKMMQPVHPKARIWFSMQGFKKEEVEYVYRYLERESPWWMAGLVAGPSSPPLAETRRRLPQKYKLRLYPDITHNKICQYQVPGLDQAIARTLGREAINPRPYEFARIHNWYAPWADGFSSYSDGAHDDVNKVIWSALAWDPDRDPRAILTEYARFHFGPDVASDAVDGILGLERNWNGPLIPNGAVEGTLLQWKRLEAREPRLAGNWRWQMMLMRAYYDAHVRRRLIQDTQLEKEANAILARADVSGSE